MVTYNLQYKGIICKKNIASVVQTLRDLLAVKLYAALFFSYQGFLPEIKHIWIWPRERVPFKNLPAVITLFCHCLCCYTFSQITFFFPQQLEGAGWQQFFPVFQVFFFFKLLNKCCPKLARDTARSDR